jgi:hypothetical protein
MKKQLRTIVLWWRGELGDSLTKLVKATLKQIEGVEEIEEKEEADLLIVLSLEDIQKFKGPPPATIFLVVTNRKDIPKELPTNIVAVMSNRLPEAVKDFMNS